MKILETIVEEQNNTGI